MNKIMKIRTLEIEVLGEKLLLCNQKVMFWEAKSMLILSDMHIGKSAHFRKNGIAIPNSVLKNDLNKLDQMISYFGAEQLLINGDILHAGDNTDVDFFCEWKKGIPADFHLIKGNHDRISKELEVKLCLTSIQEELKAGPFCFVHEFDSQCTDFQITGHIHPGIEIRNKIKNIRLPCFAVTEKQILLPAFSEFTGLDTRNLPSRATFFPLTPNEIFEM